MTTLSERDLDRAVGDGIITASQKNSLLQMVVDDARPYQQMAASDMPDEEPFELFQGFAEIFVALGIVILIGGVAGIVEFTVAEGLSEATN